MGKGCFILELLYNAYIMKKILIIIGVLAVLSLGGFAAYQFFPSSQSFADQLSALDQLNKQIASAPAISSMLSDLPSKESSKDFTGAVNLLNTALAQIDQLVQQANQVNGKITEIETFVSNDSGASKAKEEVLVGMLSDRNNAFLRIQDSQKQILELAKTYYQGIVDNHKVPAPTPAQIMAISQKIQADSKIFSDLSARIASSTVEFLSK